MHKKLPLFPFLIMIPAVLFGQSALYIVPHLGLISGSYSGVDSVNNKQGFIKTKAFLGKDFVLGSKLTFTYKSLGILVGFEKGVYSSGYYRNESKKILNRVDSKSSVSEGNAPNLLFIETPMHLKL